MSRGVDLRTQTDRIFAGLLGGDRYLDLRCLYVGHGFGDDDCSYDADVHSVCGRLEALQLAALRRNSRSALVCTNLTVPVSPIETKLLAFVETSLHPRPDTI